MSEIVGYMPKRGDFDVEYDNDAELLLAEMEFNGKIKKINRWGKLRRKWFKVQNIWNL